MEKNAGQKLERTPAEEQLIIIGKEWCIFCVFHHPPFLLYWCWTKTSRYNELLHPLVSNCLIVVASLWGWKISWTISKCVLTWWCTVWQPLMWVRLTHDEVMNSWFQLSIYHTLFVFDVVVELFFIFELLHTNVQFLQPSGKVVFGVPFRVKYCEMCSWWLQVAAQKFCDMHFL